MTEAANIPIADDPVIQRRIQRALEAGRREDTEGPETGPLDEGGYWVRLPHSMKKLELPEGGQYLRRATREAWAYAIEREGQVYTRWVMIRMVPQMESSLGVPVGQITSDDLRGIGLRIVDPSVRLVLPQIYPKLYSKAALKRLKNPSPRRHARMASEDSADTAELYLKACEKAPKEPIVWMVKEYAKKGHVVKTGTVRDWVRSLRNRGYLTKGRQGIPGALPGPELIKWRRKTEREKRKGR